MKFKFCNALAVIASLLLVSGTQALAKGEEIIVSGSSKYEGFSYEAATAMTEPSVSVKEENAVEYSIKETALTAELFSEGDPMSSGQEKIISALLERKAVIEFDNDDFLYESTPDNSQCEKFIDYYYSLIYSDKRLSHVSYGFNNLMRASTGDNTYFVLSLEPVYDDGKSGIEKLTEGLESGTTKITFDNNDFAYHTENDGQLCAKFQELLVDLTTAHPEYRVKTFSLGYSALSESIYSIAYVSVEYVPIPEDDGVPALDKILEGLLLHKEKIELDRNDFVYTVPENASSDEIAAIIMSDLGPRYFSLIDKHPELFYVDSKKQFSFSRIPMSNNTVFVSHFMPMYNGMTDEEINDSRKLIDEKVGAIVEYLEEYAVTDFEKALLLHDYICLNFEYDVSLENHDIYSFFTKGKGVCEAYAKLYRYVLEKLDINVKYASSEEMEHLWNIIEIDGNWYNVDVTWDDPVPEKPGFVMHDYFLVPDSDFQSTEIYGEEYGYDAASDEYLGYHHDYVTEDGEECKARYNGDFWTASAKGGSKIVPSPIVFDNENYYYLQSSFDIDSFKNSSAIVAVSKRSRLAPRTVVSFEDMWESVDGNEVYPGAFSGLALVNGVLIYNTPTEIRYVLPNGNHNITVAKIAYDDDEFDKHYKNKGGKIYRFGISLDGKKYEHELFYPVLTNKKKTAEDIVNNYFGIGKKYDKYDKNGRNKEKIEIDYFIIDSPSDTDIDERDFIIDICSDTIHSFEKGEEHKATYLTKGWWKKVCKVCHEAETEETEPEIMKGKNPHAPNAKDVASVIKAFIGEGSLVDGDDDDINPDSMLDFDEDGRFKLHDILKLMHMIREQKESEK